jgi:hypothetical protein
MQQKSMHKFEHVSVFHFPKDKQLRNELIRRILRENLNVTDRTVVCEKHFASHFIIRTDNVRRSDETIFSERRDIPKLTEVVYPCYFSNTPSYLPSEPPTKRKTSDTRHTEMGLREKQQLDSW